jgi:acyl-CoA synthetase (AMP-forming)/AMP-acid ligase II
MAKLSALVLVCGDERIERIYLEARAVELRDRVGRGSVYQLTNDSTEELIAAVLGLDGHCSRVELVPAGVIPIPIDPVVAEFDGTTEWVIYTSGTTGEPKAVSHTLESLSRAVRPSDGSRVWGLLYDPHRLAGLAVVLQALASESLLVESRRESIGDRVASLRAAGVTALSATPTLWRQILQTGAIEDWNLARITLGGEVSDQRLLDALASAFPQARITHIFAASETGVAFSVGDGKEGFPSSYLTTPPRGTALEIRDGILWVHSPSSSLASPDGFASTGDVVEIHGDRVTFAGRESGMVNVGGMKVYPEQVEVIIREHPSVAEAVVYSKSNPFSGNVLLAKVILRSPDDRAPASIRRWVAEKLPAPMVPAQVLVVNALKGSTNGKVVRE